MRIAQVAPLMESVPLDPWGRPYLYRYIADPRQPVLTSLGPDGLEGTQDDIGRRH